MMLARVHAELHQAVSDAVHVRTQEVFDRAAETAPPGHWIWDGVHPLPQGHELIARNWLQQVSARWPA